MKIVNVYNGDFVASSQGGGMRYLRDLIKEQAKMGYEIHLMGLGDPESEPHKIDIEGVNVNYIPVSDNISWPVFLYNLGKHLFERPNHYEGAIFHIHRIYFAPVFKYIRNARVVATIHSKTFTVFEKKFPFLKFLTPALTFAEGLIIKYFVHKLSAAGEYGIDLYKERHGKVGDEIILLRNPSRLEIDNAKPVEKIRNKATKIILCVGRIASVKRPMAVLDLFEKTIKKHQEIAESHHLFYIGEGEDSEKIRAEIRKRGLADKVTVYGSVQASEMPSIYLSGDCMVLLSSSEVAPYSVKEALTAGIPVFATDVGIVRKYLPENCGMIIDPESPENRVDEFYKFLNTTYSKDDCMNFAAKLRKEEEEIFASGLSNLYSKIESK